MAGARRVSLQRRDWEEAAGFNPEWAVLTAADAKFGGWDMDAFFRSGLAQTDEVMSVAGELGLPRRRERVLDFGCGVGRLSRALSSHFRSYVGVDISAPMIARARELNAGCESCEFVLNEEEGLSRFADREFDAVVSFLVLQHMPDREMIRAYLRELARVLAPGGLAAIQVLTRIPALYTRLRPRRRLYRLARALGMSVERAHRWGLQAIMLTSIPEDEVVGVLRAGGCETLRRETAPASERGMRSSTFYATRPE